MQFLTCRRALNFVDSEECGDDSINRIMGEESEIDASFGTSFDTSTTAHRRVALIWATASTFYCLASDTDWLILNNANTAQLHTMEDICHVISMLFWIRKGLQY